MPSPPPQTASTHKAGPCRRYPAQVCCGLQEPSTHAGITHTPGNGPVGLPSSHSICAACASMLALELQARRGMQLLCNAQLLHNMRVLHPTDWLTAPSHSRQWPLCHRQAFSAAPRCCPHTTKPRQGSTHACWRCHQVQEGKTARPHPLTHPRHPDPPPLTHPKSPHSFIMPLSVPSEGGSGTSTGSTLCASRPAASNPHVRRVVQLRADACEVKAAWSHGKGKM